MSKKLKPFETDQLNSEARDLYDAINHEHPLPCVLISTAFIEQSLATLLHGVLKAGSTTDSLFSHEGGVLGDLSSRAKMAYCLELITKEQFTNVQRIGEIRNIFAHSHLAIDFTDSRVIDLCKELTMGAEIAASTRIDAATGIVEHGVDFIEGFGPHERFKLSAVMTANWIVMAALSAKMKNTKMRTDSPKA